MRVPSSLNEVVLVDNSRTNKVKDGDDDADDVGNDDDDDDDHDDEDGEIDERGTSTTPTRAFVVIAKLGDDQSESTKREAGRQSLWQWRRRSPRCAASRSARRW
jgi:hypothetical protein